MGAYEITEKYLMVYLIFFSICYAYREGANVRVTFLVERLPPQLRLAVNYLVQIFSILYGICLIIATIPHSLHVIAVGKTLDVYNIPLGPACMVVPVGLFFLTLRMVLDLWQIKKGRAGFFKQDTATT
jgi:TRAP-type C4-dicarboxylate transport system permease small subunit